jgi:Tfp pilus assembly PilM family ATPase
MLSYSTQIVICDSIRETIRQALNKSSQLSTKLKASSVPTTDSILRSVSLLSNMNTEDQLKAFIIKRVLTDLRLTESQKEQLNLTV